MDISDFKFRITNKTTKESIVIGFNDIFGYESEVCGVFIRHDLDDIPESFKDACINHNSGYGCNGLNTIWDVEAVK